MLEQLQVTERALVVGHSLGALLAIWMAFKHPDRVRGVIAFGPPLFRDARHAHRQIANLGGFERLFASDHRAANWLAKTMCRNLCSARPRLAAKLFSLARPHLPYPLAEDATRHSWIAYSQTLRQVILAAEGAQWLGATRLPIRLVAGGQDRYLDLDFLKELAGRNTHLQVDVWPDDGHDLPLLLPDRCMATISSWRSDEITTAQSRLDTDSDH
jgi:pimeloyl-ACP methyl ester carboxylesterase